jgi:hypothetical protein
MHAMHACLVSISTRASTISVPGTTLKNVLVVLVARCELLSHVVHVWRSKPIKHSPAVPDLCCLLCCRGVTAIKAIQAGDITAASKTNKGKALASGSYTFWSADGSGWGTGTAASVAGADTVEKCLQACNTDEMCAAVYMAGVVDETAAPTGCKKIYGDATNGASQRSVTKVNLDRLVLKASVFA